MDFLQKLNNTILKNNSLLCVGLDTDPEKIPQHLKNDSDPLFSFNKAIIDATHDLVCSYKPNSAYYEAQGTAGITALKKTIEYVHQTYPEIPLIDDAKRADIGSTSQQYAKAIFDYLGFDAVTVNPYLGADSVEPFLQYKEKGIILLCRTSNPGAADFQDLQVYSSSENPELIEGDESRSSEDTSSRPTRTIPLYIHVAKKVIEWNKLNNNCLMVVGATWPKQMQEIRALAPAMFFLVPGLGAQGGDLKETLINGLTKEKSGLILNASRAIIYASANEDFAQKAKEKAQELRESINQYRK